MSGITNGNDYMRGWKEGHQAALDGKDKDYNRMGLSWKFVFHGDFAVSEYTKGYNNGYEAGLNEKEVVRKVELINNNNEMDYNSANLQNFVREMQALQNLNGRLVLICNRIRQVNGLFKGYLSVMKDTGVPIQECEEFAEKCYAVDERNFKSIFDRITQYDIPWIRKYMEQIQRQLAAATGMAIPIELKSPNTNVSAIIPSNAQISAGGPQDYETQIRAICNMMNFMVDQRDEMKETLYKYQQDCDEMIRSGVPKQIVDHYKPMAEFNWKLIENTYNHIQAEDYPQMKKVYGEIVDSLSELGKSANMVPKSM